MLRRSGLPSQARVRHLPLGCLYHRNITEASRGSWKQSRRLAENETFLVKPYSARDRRAATAVSDRAGFLGGASNRRA